MKHQTEKDRNNERRTQKVASEHMKECLTLSEVQAAASQNTRSLKNQMEPQMKC